MTLQDTLREKMSDENSYDVYNDVVSILCDALPANQNPISKVKWVELSKVRANDYNPNEVADEEMKLLYRSIKNDGYTQPVVTVYDEEEDMYEIVDGFHRYKVMKRFDDIAERSDGRLPITIIDKDIKDRMASTVRHNRARGKHKIEGMTVIVRDMLDKGWSDEKICKELGMEAEELARLKHTTGFSKLFEDVDYSMSWKDTKQIEIEKEHDGYDGP